MTLWKRLRRLLFAGALALLFVPALTLTGCKHGAVEEAAEDVDDAVDDVVDDLD
jgi:hypothetical protein